MQTSYPAGPRADRTDTRAGGQSEHHSEAVTVRTPATGEAPAGDRKETLAVRSQVRAGRLSMNHSEALVVRSEVRAGVVPIGANHSQALAEAGGSRT
ncbi:hypothetical protein [Micromonospora sp. KC213]|uniref:hypothetical protein n=1 Tax=Micromonospora sp. KC213 TaxID=2530378 RepID=UPI001050AEBF|nr:hypothetical protein [Micromonospora sp. KC213]TDC41145.1 hypothetical protein E1166_12935 [Micromonospora sp. KC213]